MFSDCYITLSYYFGLLWPSTSYYILRNLNDNFKLAKSTYTARCYKNYSPSTTAGFICSKKNFTGGSVTPANEIGSYIYCCADNVVPSGNDTCYAVHSFTFSLNAYTNCMLIKFALAPLSTKKSTL